MPTYERKPHQSVVKVTIRKQERTYFSKVLSGRKEAVRISVDPYDYTAQAVLTDLNGIYLDSAEPFEVTNPYDTKEIARKRERQAELMKWIRSQSKRLREGFGLIETAIPKINTTTHTAKKAEKAKELHERQKENATLVAKEHRETGRAAAADLVRKFAAEDTDGIAIPKESKARYRLWLSLDGAFQSGKELSPSEEEFYLAYRRNMEWKIHRKLHEESGPLYIDERAASLQVVN
jgi:hypothetical protein